MSRERIYYKEGYKYQLHRTYTLLTTIRPERPINTRYISLSLMGQLEIREGYAWDGPSGPTFDTLDSMRASLVHDALYQLMRMGLLDRRWKSAIDILFERILIQDGMWEWRARMWYRGVDKLADSATSSENQKKVYVAPDTGGVKYLSGGNR